MTIAGPGVVAGATCRQPAELLDVYPTLIELCGLQARPELEGHSLRPQLRETCAPRAWPAITTHNPGNHGVRTEQWRYIRYADGSEELYDVQADPEEWKNLARDPKLDAVKTEHVRWLPQRDAPLAPGSSSRILEQRNGGWFWEGVRIDPSTLEQ